MKFAIIIPAYNEEAFIALTLQSLVSQTLKPHQIIVVNDNSTDKTAEIINQFAQDYPFIQLINKKSEAEHLPGSKVVEAFNYGFGAVNTNYDILCKFDADLIFPENYLEQIARIFKNDNRVGMAGGFCHIEKEGKWILENLTNKDHIRGALKAYKKECFTQIGGLKTAMGWDTLDELLAQFHNWKVVTDEKLHVKHLKPTGKTYSKSAKYKQGEAFYRMRYGLKLTLIASVKLAYKKGNISFLSDYISGYLKAKKQKLPFLVTAEEGQFIRKLRWKNIRQKFI